MSAERGPYTLAELDALLNGWSDRTMGNTTDAEAIRRLDEIGAAIGYGALAQLAQWLYEIQCHRDPTAAARMNRERFAALGWPLPPGFNEAAVKRSF